MCGDKKERAFTSVLLNHEHSKKLFMTATPKYEGEVSMRDRTIFGGVAFRYHLREGIDAGFVNPFRLQLLVASGSGPCFESDIILVRQIGQAMQEPGVSKMLVFCRNIAHVETLKNLTETTLGPEMLCLSAHSQLSPRVRQGVLKRFTHTTIPALLFNCRLFQEGVEIPALNAIFFAAPRSSPIDIIQSVCRPLNSLPRKPPSVIFVPLVQEPTPGKISETNIKHLMPVVPFVDALLSEDPSLYDFLLGGPANGYACLWKATDKELNELPLLETLRKAVQFGTSTSPRSPNRLLKTWRIPWERGYRELERTVTVCGRYPKTVDAAEVAPGIAYPFHRWYRWCVQAYLAGKRLQLRGLLGLNSDALCHEVADFCCYFPFASPAGEPLEPFQLHALEKLSGWTVFGVKGPYPWNECMAYLETWLEDHSGDPPMVEINRGGYVGLDATWMERLSGALTCINQGDGRSRKRARLGSGFTVSEQKQEDLDRITKKYCLLWRKDRNSGGDLLTNARRVYIGRPTFIQTAHQRFKRAFRRSPKDPYFQEHFPGYGPESLKYRYQERPAVYLQQLMPPKWRAVNPNGTKYPKTKKPGGYQHES